MTWTRPPKRRAVFKVQAYAGFWRRLGAAGLDSLFIAVVVTLPFVLVVPTSRETFLAMNAASLGVTVLYSVILHGLYGRTVGKLCFNIRVKTKDFSPIGFKHALLRDSVAIAIQLLGFAGFLVAAERVDFSVVQGMQSHLTFFMGPHDAIKLKQFTQEFQSHDPFLVYVRVLGLAWYFSEFFTMLLHPRRRAIHDLIAGTVVVKEKI
jgi:uncharacterized RDD family membrane protein YckC